MNNKTFLTAVFAVLILLLAAIADTWAWQSLYLQTYTAFQVFSSLATFVPIVWLLCWLLCRSLGGARATQVLHGLVVILSTYILSRTIKGVIALDSVVLIPIWFRMSLLILSLTLAVVLLRLPDGTWSRIDRAAIVAGTIFMFSAPIIAVFLGAEVVWLIPSATPTSASMARFNNTLILLLDELSDPASIAIVDSLENTGLYVSKTSLVPAGKNTMDAIPAMLTRLDFGDARPCGPSQVCSRNRVLDFSKLSVGMQNVDIVGFYHPYCRIQGLRSCHGLQSERSPTSRNPFVDIVCTFASKFRLFRIPGCYRKAEESPTDIERLSFRSPLNDAPFWQLGGVLYAHLPIPHPQWQVTSGTLDADYEANLESANLLITRLVARLKDRFGKDFLLAVISDHPLRNAIWCSVPPYDVTGCQTRPEYRSGKVPLIMASPKQFTFPDITSNRDVFWATLNASTPKSP